MMQSYYRSALDASFGQSIDNLRSNIRDGARAVSEAVTMWVMHGCQIKELVQ
jgi:hypothetical protein